MEDDADEPVLGVVEIRQALEKLSKIDRVRLLKIAVRYSFGSGIEADDLVQEALVAALAGTRRCPRGTDVMIFLYGAIRSIASAKLASPWQGRRDSLSEEDADGRLKFDPASSRDVMREAAAEQGLRLLSDAFEGNEPAQMVLLCVAEQCTPAEIQETCGLTPVEYDSQRKAIRRMINRKYPNGWQP
ncbi:MAG: hypothetical protein JWR07_1811 [Nevskia sp.]|nr:hypothetical protein [Nevskia sp.]